MRRLGFVDSARTAALPFTVFTALMLGHAGVAPPSATALTRLPNPAPTQAFGAWRAACVNDGSAFCNASTPHDGKAVPSGKALRLEVFRQSPGGAFGIAFSLEAAPADPNRPLRVRIDREAMQSLIPRSEFAPTSDNATTLPRHANTPHRYILTKQSTTDDLLARMRSGERLSITYTGTAGRALSATFDLDGLNDALAFIERQQPGLRVRKPLPAAPTAPSRAPLPFGNRANSGTNHDSGLRRQSTAFEECWAIADTASQAEACLDRKLAAARADMNEVEARLEARMREMDRIAPAEPNAPGAAASLVEAQRAFARFIEAECARRAAASGRDTRAREFRQACEVDMTRQRTDTLRAGLRHR